MKKQPPPPTIHPPVLRAIPHALLGLCVGSLVIPHAEAEVSVWGGGTGYSDVPANWAQGVLPAPGDIIEVPGGSLFARRLVTSELAVRAGAQAVALAEGGPGISIVGPSDSEPNGQPLLGTLFVGSADAPGELFLTNSIFFNGEGRFRLTHPLSLVAADPGSPSSRLGISFGNSSFGGQGTISASLRSAVVVRADIPGGTLTLDGPEVELLDGALAEKGGILRLNGALVKGFSDLPLKLEAKPNSEIVIAANTHLVKPQFIDGGGTITQEGAPLIVNAAYSGDFTLRHPITVGGTLDLRALNGLPAGKLTFTRTPEEPSGLVFNNDYNFADGTGSADGPSRIIGGEVILKDPDAFMSPLISFVSDTGSRGVWLEEGAALRGRGVLNAGFNLTHFESRIEANNPGNALLTEEAEPGRRLVMNYRNQTNIEVINAGTLSAAKGGLLQIQGRIIFNKNDGGTYPNGTPHPLGKLEARDEGSGIQLENCRLLGGSVLLPHALASFFSYGGTLSSGLSALFFDGPGKFGISSRLHGELIVTPGTAVRLIDSHGAGNSIDGNVFFNGGGRFRLEGATIARANPEGDTLTVSATLEGAGYLQTPLFLTSFGHLSGMKLDGLPMTIACPVLNEGGIIAEAGDTSLRIEPGYTVENINNGKMVLYGPMDLYGRIKGNQIESQSTLHSWGGVLEDVTITKSQAAGPNNVEVSVSSSLHLRGKIYNNAIIRALETATIVLEGPVLIGNQPGANGRVELSPNASIDDLEDRAPILTLGPRQTLLARRFEGQVGKPEDFRANIWVPVENNGAIIADGMVLYLDRHPSGKGRFSAVNGGEIQNLTILQRVGEFLETTLRALGGRIKLNAPNGANIKNANMEARLPAGAVVANTPVGAAIVANGGGNVINGNGSNIIALGGGNIEIKGGADLVGLNGSNVVANGGNNVINGNGSTIAVLDGAKVIANGGANVTGVPGGRVGLRGARNAATAGLTRVIIGDGGTLAAAAVEIQNDALLEISKGQALADDENFVLLPDTISYGNIQGTFDLQEGGAWAADIGGPVAGQTYDQLVVTGAAQLAGELRVRILNGFRATIQPADTFIILTATGGITGLPSNSKNGRIATRDRWGSFAIAISLDGTQLVLNDFQALPHPILAWTAGFGLTGADAQMSADPDHDGRTNLEEFACLTSPVDGREVPGMTVSRNGAELVVSLTRRSGDTHRLRYDPETSTGLTGWLPLVAPWTHDCVQVTPETETVTITGPVTESRRLFRMRITAE